MTPNGEAPTPKGCGFSDAQRGILKGFLEDL